VSVFRVLGLKLPDAVLYSGLSLRFRDLAYIRLRCQFLSYVYDYRSNFGRKLYARCMFFLPYAPVAPYASCVYVCGLRSEQNVING